MAQSYQLGPRLVVTTGRTLISTREFEHVASSGLESSSSRPTRMRQTAPVIMASKSYGRSAGRSRTCNLGSRAPAERGGVEDGDVAAVDADVPKSCQP